MTIPILSESTVSPGNCRAQGKQKIQSPSGYKTSSTHLVSIYSTLECAISGLSCTDINEYLKSSKNGAAQNLIAGWNLRYFRGVEADNWCLCKIPHNTSLVSLFLFRRVLRCSFLKIHRSLPLLTIAFTSIFIFKDVLKMFI